jgi:amino acid transporter
MESKTTQNGEQPQGNLIRGISRLDLTAIVINTIIGAGIFGLPAKVTALIGVYSLLAFVFCAVIIALIVLCFAEVGSRFETTGGSYLYARKAFGSFTAFEVGWLYWIARVATAAANTNLLVSYLAFFVPVASSTFGRAATIAIVTAGLTAINYLGVRQSARATNFFTVGKLAPLIIFALIGLFFIEPGNFTNNQINIETGAFSSAVLILIYAFVGFEASVIPAGEMRDPQRNIPFALLTALGIIAVLYIVIQLVCLGTLPMADLAKSERPLADAANVFMGGFGASLIALGAIISICGNLNSGLLTASRLPFAMAEQRELPAVLMKTHEQYKTPFISLFLTAAVIFIFTLQTSFVAALTISTITRLLVYATTCAALPLFRVGDNLAPAARFRAPAGYVVAALALISIAWLLSNVRFVEIQQVAILAVLGLFIFLLNRAFRPNVESAEESDLVENDEK